MKFYQSLKFKFALIMSIIVSLSLFMMGFGFKQTAAQSLKTRTEEYINALTDAALGKAKGETERHLQTLKVLAETPLVKDQTIPLIDKCRQLTEIANTNPDYENFGYYNKDGESYTAGGKYIKLERDYITNALNGQYTIKDPVYTDITDMLLQIYAVPVYDENKKPVACLVANAFVEQLSTKISGLVFGSEDSQIQVVSYKTGVIVASTNVDDVKAGLNINVGLNSDEGISAALKNAVAGRTGSTEYYDKKFKKKFIAAYKAIPETDWFIFCIAERAVFYGAIDNLSHFLFFSLAVTVLITIVIVSIYLVRAFKPLTNVKNAIEDVASGDADLTKRLSLKNKDELGEIVKGFNAFTGKLHEIISQLKESKADLGTAGENLKSSMEDTSSSITQILANIESVHSQINNQSNSVQSTAGAVNEIASNIESLERMITNQSSGVEQASAAVEEMIGNISSVNNSMEKMSDSFNELTISAKSGSQVQAEVNQKIEQIKNQSETLQEANVAIAAIAEQTNLLAMNAAIEAAHAGDAGKGFAVVADEIRKLSETSGQQSKTIGDQLTSIQTSIADVVNASIQSSQAFESVTSKIKETDELVRQIRAAMEEQNEGSKQISTALHSMNDSTIEVRTAGQEMAEGNKAILVEVDQLRDTTGVIKQSMDKISTSAGSIQESSDSLTEIANSVEMAVGQIGSQIDLFTV